jgi:hypothetical protein
MYAAQPRAAYFVVESEENGECWHSAALDNFEGNIVNFKDVFPSEARGKDTVNNWPDI